MGVTISRYGRFWAVYEGGETEKESGKNEETENSKLVCLCVYRKGAVEVSRRLGVPHPTLPQRMKTERSEKLSERSDEDVAGSTGNDFAYGRRGLSPLESESSG